MKNVTRIRKKFLCFSVFLLIITVFESCKPKKALIRQDTKSGETKIWTDASQAPRDLITDSDRSVIQQYAKLLEVSEKQLKNKQLYVYIQDWMGVPHRDAGVDKTGIDCSAFVGNLFQEVFKETLPRTSAEMGEKVKRKYESQLKEGDLVFFSFGKKRIDHVGVYLHNGMFVHVSTSKGVIISRLKDPWYYKVFVRGGPIQ